jgi:Skp family chaperone for outer membrane proteins
MIKSKLVGLAALALGAITIPAAAQQATQAGVSGLLQDGKVAVMNTAVFPEKLGELRQKYEQVQAQFKDRTQRLQALDQEVKQLTQDLAAKSPNLSQEKAQEMQQTIDEKKRKGQRELEDLQADYNKALESSTKPVRDKLAQFVSSYATQHGIIMIIDLPVSYQNGVLAYWQPSIDVTDDFIAQYNKQNPVPGGAPASQPGASQPGPSKPAGAKPQR